MIVYLRNVHAKRIVYLPVRPGWCRVLKPAVTTAVPAALLHTAAVRQLLLRKLVDVVHGAAWDADTRQARASRTDWAAQSPRPSRASSTGCGFGCGSVSVAGHPDDRWTAERVAEFRALLLSEAKPAEIAATMGMAPDSVHAKACQLGLARRALKAGLTSPRRPQAV